MSLFFTKPRGHLIKMFAVTPVFPADDKPFIADTTIRKGDDGSCSIFHIGKTVPATHIPGKFPECSFKETATGMVPITITQQRRRIYDQGTKTFPHSPPHFHLTIVFA